jgi:hypothetical protein
MVVVVEAMMVTMAGMICDPGREDWARFGRLARGRLSLLLYGCVCCVRTEPTRAVGWRASMASMT